MDYCIEMGVHQFSCSLQTEFLEFCCFNLTRNGFCYGFENRQKEQTKSEFYYLLQLFCYRKLRVAFGYSVAIA